MTIIDALVVLIILALAIYFSWMDGFRDGYYKGWIARGDAEPKLIGKKNK